MKTVILYIIQSREKGLLLQKSIKKNYQTVIETCFEMLKSSEHKILCRKSNYKSPNFMIKLDQRVLELNVTIKF